MANPEHVLRPGDALVIVDVQIDFCPGGALPIDRGDDVVPIMNRWIHAASAAGVPVYASRDWHPAGHVSFVDSGGRWPPHCLQGSDGARFHSDLDLPGSATIVTKGARIDRDQYSAFDDTGLGDELRSRGIARVWIGGLAQDVCVRATVLDACQQGFDVVVIEDATRPVSRENGAASLDDMRRAGARVEDTQ